MEQSVVLIEVALGPHFEKLSSGYILSFKRHSLPSELACVHCLTAERSSTHAYFSPFQLSWLELAPQWMPISPQH